MADRLPNRIRDLVARIRDQEALPASSAAVFDLVLEIVERVAAHERLIQARGRELEPDHLAARVFGDPQLAAVRAVESLLAGVSRRDLATIERTLLALERARGAVGTTPPNHRILVDGALLGSVAFVYSRKFREVLATRTIYDKKATGALLPELLARVDEIFPNGRPAYLWRLGPEYGTDRNVAHLLDRRDWFIVRGLYRSRARRLARGVEVWKEMAGGEWIGENCYDDNCRPPVRSLVIKWREGRRERYATLVTNLANVPWEDIYRFYNNRSCKRPVEIVVDGAEVTARRRLAASFLILSLFTFRNLRSWAWAVPEPGAGGTTTTTAVTASQKRQLHLIDSQRPMVLERMDQVIAYLTEITGGSDALPGVGATPAPMSYLVTVEGTRQVAALTAGQVVHVDRDGEGGIAVLVSHGQGFTTRYGNLAQLVDGVRVGADVEAGQPLGSLADGVRLGFEANLSAKFLDRALEPTVPEMLADGGNLLFDPLGLLTAWEPERPGDEQAVVEPEDDRAPKPPTTADADAYRLTSPFLAGETIFIANAALVDDLELEPLPDVYDDDVVLDVLGEEVS